MPHDPNSFSLDEASDGTALLPIWMMLSPGERAVASLSRRRQTWL